MATVTKASSKATRSTAKVNLLLRNQAEFKKAFGSMIFSIAKEILIQARSKMEGSLILGQTTGNFRLCLGHREAR